MHLYGFVFVVLILINVALVVSTTYEEAIVKLGGAIVAHGGVVIVHGEA